jgi:hypothetical protein
MGKRQRRRDRDDQATDNWTSNALLLLTLNGTQHELLFRSKAAAEAFLLDLAAGLEVIEATYDPDVRTFGASTRSARR